MHINKALIDRVLDVPPINDNAVMMYRRLISLIEEYNRIARDKGLHTKKIPVYSNDINCALIRQLTVSILKDIDRVKNIKKKEKILTGVTFKNKTFKEGIWIYTTNDNNDVTVTLNVNEFSNTFTRDTITLGYAEMPYEKLIDTEGNEYLIISYEYMFTNLPGSSFRYLTIDNWTNKNAKNMNNMFYECFRLRSLNLGDKFDTSSVTNMSAMFYNCQSITSLTLGDGFNISKVTDMNSMFYDCVSLISLTLGDNFNISSVTDMTNIFAGCFAFTSITLYQVAKSIVKELPSDTWTITDADSNRIGEVVIEIEGLPAKWSPEVPTTWTNTPWTLVRWKMATNIEFTIGTITATELSTYAAWKDDDSLWYYIQNEENISVYADKDAIIERMNGGTELVLDYKDMPYELLIDKDGKKWKVNNYSTFVYDNKTYGLFGYRILQLDWYNNVINKLTSLTINNWTNKNVTNMYNMFDGYEKLPSLTLNNFNTSSVTNTSGMFLACSALTSLDLSSFDTSSVTNAELMFGYCEKLTSVKLYKSAINIITQLPSATWNINGSSTETVQTYYGSFENEPIWTPTDKPAQWEDDAPWTLSRTIQGQ